MATRGYEGVTMAEVTRKQAQKRPTMPHKARSKYNATPTTVGGIRFDSAKEARRYQELKALEKAGEIRDLELQPEYPLVVGVWTLDARIRRVRLIVDGKPVGVEVVEIGKWRGDFRYLEKTLSASENDHFQRVIEDVKGFKTPLYRWKKKHVEAQYGIVIREI